MKKLLLLPVLLFFAGVLFAQGKKVSVRIIQDSAVYPVAGQEITLRKEPFKIVVTLSGMEGIYLYAGFTDSIYRLQENEKIPGFKDLPAMAMAETSFNKDQELIISDDGWAYWFYDKELDWHRFDKDVLVTADSIKGTKTIKQFYFPEPEHTVAVRDIGQPLYLFFVAIKEEDKDENPAEELTRLKMKINWE